MTITKQSKEFSKIELYLMTADKGIQSVKNLEDGATLQVIGYLEYDDVNAKSEESHLLSIMGEREDGRQEVWCCQSQTFKDSFYEIAELFGDDAFGIVKISGVSKSDRPYVDCKLSLTAVD